MTSGDNDLTSFGINRKKVGDNTVGSWNAHFWEKYPNHCYAFGLWCSDGYHRTSSIGLTSVDLPLIQEFREFLLAEFPEERLRLRIYHPIGNRPDEKAFRELCGEIVMYPMRKCSQVAMQLYVNSRPLLRMIQKSRREVDQIKEPESVIAYFAGRFDGDGSIDSNGRSYCRIVYGNEIEAQKDQQLLEKIGIKNASVYEYRAASEWCLYIPRGQTASFMKLISRYQTGPKNVYSNPVETSSTFF